MKTIKFNRFVDKLLDQTKKQTCRRHQKVEVGEWFEARDSSCTPQVTIGYAKCTEAIQIRIWPAYLDVFDPKFNQWNEISRMNALDQFARLDGFKDWTDMVTWAHDNYGLPYEGFAHRWEKFFKEKQTESDLNGKSKC